MDDAMKNALGIDRLKALEAIYDSVFLTCPSFQEGRCSIQAIITEEGHTEEGQRCFCMFSTCPFMHFVAAMVLDGKLISMIFLDVLSMNVGGIRSLLATEEKW